MALQPKTEHGSLTRSIPSTREKGYSQMNISQLFSILRVAYEIEVYDKVEEEMLNRETKLRAEIGSLRKKIELERSKRSKSIEAEERLKITEEQCKKGKQAQKNYELLLKRLKNSGLVTAELRKKHVTLEREVCELKEFKKKMLEEVKCVDKLRTKICKLEQEKVGDKSALDALNIKNTELKEEVKKNLTAIQSLRTENGKLTNEKCKKGKQAQENYELLLKRMKNSGLVIDELRKKNATLEGEVCELKELKIKMLEDAKCVDDLRTKICKLEEENVGYKSALAALNIKNTELKEEVKKNFTAIERLRTENDKLTDEKCKKGKQAQENNELLLKRMKNSDLVIDELRKKNVTLEREVCELKELKIKMLEDIKCVDELRTKICKLEEEKAGDKSALDALNIKNTELKEEVKKNFTAIERLRTENDKLTDEKVEHKKLFNSMKRKYGELRASVVKLEDDINLLMSEGASDCGNTEVEPNPGVFYAVKDEEVIDDYELENDTGEPVPFPRTKDTLHSLRTSTVLSPKIGNKHDASEKEIIDLCGDDDDDVGSPNQGFHRETVGENEHPPRVETFTRIHASDIQTSSTSPSCDEMDNPPLKRAKTSLASSDTYTLPGYFLTRRI